MGAGHILRLVVINIPTAEKHTRVRTSDALLQQIGCRFLDSAHAPLSLFTKMTRRLIESQGVGGTKLQGTDKLPRSIKAPSRQHKMLRLLLRAWPRRFDEIIFQHGDSPAKARRLREGKSQKQEEGLRMGAPQGVHFLRGSRQMVQQR